MAQKRLRNPLLFSSLLGIALWAIFGWNAHALAAQTPVVTRGQSPAQDAPLDQVVLTPAKDNTLYDSTDKELSNGSGQFLFAGRTATGVNLRGLLAFDLNGQVPSGSTIVSVTLQLNVSLALTPTYPIVLHRVQADWGEGTSVAPGNESRGAPATADDATWVHSFYMTTTWSTPGGDFIAAPSATAAVGNLGDYSWSSPGMVADVQAWLADPTTNFGWILVGDETDPKSAKRFGSRENTEATVRPQLTIVFQGGPVLQPMLYLPLVRNS